MTLLDEALMERYEYAKTKNDTQDMNLIFQWTKQGIIGNARQFRMLFGKMVEKEAKKIEQELNNEAKRGNAKQGFN